MLNDENTNQTASDTLHEVGQALEKDAKATGEHIKDAAEWTADKAKDTKDAVENEAEERGLNSGDPSRNDD